MQTEEFLNWELIGKGAERHCYLNPEDTGRCVKVSKKSQSKQTLREIKYFRMLQKKQVPFTQIPKFFGVVETENYLGIEQEVIANKDGTSALNLGKYLLNSNNDDLNKTIVALEELKKYLLFYNIIPSDLGVTNILMQESGDRLKAVLIDGFGSTEIIPISDYLPYFGRRKIERKWTRFMEDRVQGRITACIDKQ